MQLLKAGDDMVCCDVLILSLGLWFTHWSVCSFPRSLVHSFVCPLNCWLVDLLVRLFAYSNVDYSIRTLILLSKKKYLVISFHRRHFYN